MAVATPGAGKTTFALRIATELMEDRTVERVIVVVPTEHLKTQWSSAAARVGLALDPAFSNSSAVNPSMDGIVVTYAQVGMHPFKHRAVASARRTLVILDEIHHAGDAKSWGDGVKEAYDDVNHRLALTGTPFRSDDSPIPFVQYVDDGEGHKVSARTILWLWRCACRRRRAPRCLSFLLWRSPLARLGRRGTCSPFGRHYECGANRPSVAHRLGPQG